MDKEAFSKASVTVMDYYRDKTNGYSSGRIAEIESCLNKIGNHVQAMTNRFDISEIEDVLLGDRSSTCHSKKTVRHVVGMLRMAEMTGKTDSRKIYDCKDRYNLPQKLKQTRNDFARHIEKLYERKRTIIFYEYASDVFLSFLASHGVSDISAMTVQHLHDFVCFGLEEYAASTKKEMLYRIRRFLRYLFLDGEISFPVLSYLDCNVRVPEKVVSVLSEKQEKAIVNHSDDNAKDCRNKAIALCCLKLGLRISDTLRLRFKDINWETKTIGIVQLKTGVPLKLPLPDAVGNAIASYVCLFRPESEKDFIFLTLQAPYNPLGSSDRGNIVALIGEPDAQVPSGANHLLRRTCASDMLRDGTDILTISTVLGHADIASIDPYLSIDQKNMSDTPLGSISVPLPEVLK